MRRPAVVVPAVVAAAAAIGFVALLAVGSLTGDDGPTVDAVRLYESRIVGAARQGGQTVEMGLKVAIGDLGAEHRTAPAVVAEQAVAWRRDLVRARQVFQEVDPPSGLGDARTRFVAALDAYVKAAELVRAAALAPVEERDRLLDDAVAAGEAGDRLYDRAAADLQQVRRRLGLGPSPDFPDPDGVL